MAKPKKPDGGKTIMDVAHPGKSAPPANSKSVILSNRPLLKDPMVVDEGAPHDSDADSSLAKVSNKSGAQPLTAPLLKTEEPALAEADAKPDHASEADPSPAETPAEPTKPADTATAPADKPPAPADSISSSDEAPAPETAEPSGLSAPPTPPETPDDNVNDSLPPDAPDDGPAVSKTKDAQPPAGKTEAAAQTEVPSPDNGDAKPAEGGTAESAQSNDMAKKLEAETTKEAQRQAAIDKLTDSKKYYLPINAVEKRRSRRFVILGIILSLLLIVAWADIALDAGLIHLGGIKPLTHFFSN